MIKIRRSRREESQALGDIWCRSVDATHDFLQAADRIAIEKQVRAFLPDAPLWVAVTADDLPVGFMLLAEQHLEALFVDPDFRGAGVGRLLITHARALAPQLTTDVNEQNAQATGFYLKMGFCITGRSEKDSEGRSYPLLHLRYQC